MEDLAKAIREQLELAKDFPDAAILRYTFPRGRLWPKYSTIDTVTPETITADMFATANKFTPARQFRYVVENTKIDFIDNAKKTRSLRLLVHLADHRNQRRRKVILFAVGNFIIYPVLFFVALGVFSRPRLMGTTPQAQGLDLKYLLALLTIISALAGVSPQISKWLTERRKKNEQLIAPEQLAFEIARRYKNVTFGIAFILASISFFTFAVLLLCRISAFSTWAFGYFFLVLAVESSMIALIFYLKQRAACSKLIKNLEAESEPISYREIS